MIKKFIKLFFISILLLSGCSVKVADKPNHNAVYYQIFVGSFYDSDSDGIGDLKGVIEKLDYLQNDLGVSGIWLSPIHPSPTYHKYDVTDYYDIDKDFGTLADFEELSKKLNERGMDLMLDFVFNHTSSQHPWFIEAKSASLNGQCDDNEFCDYYNFSKQYDAGYTKLNDDLYYESQFWSEMPDLNLDNLTVRNEIVDIAKFWMDKGVNAFRLDATTHFYENKTSKNTEILGWFKDEVSKINPKAYVVGEAWTNKTIIYDMYESGIDSFFNFDFSQNDGSIVKSINRQKGHQLAKTVLKYNEEIKMINPNAIDALFLSNHDNGRSGAYFGDQIEKQKLAASIYMLMPGNSFVYYGEEIGMLGSGVDENKRLPMQWGKNEIANEPQRYVGANYREFEIDGVNVQLKAKDSLLAHYQNIIQIKNRYPQINEGSLKVIDLNKDEVYALKHGDLIVIHNLSNRDIEIEIIGEILEKINSKNSIKNNRLILSGYSSFLIKSLED